MNWLALLSFLCMLIAVNSARSMSPGVIELTRAIALLSTALLTALGGCVLHGRTRQTARAFTLILEIATAGAFTVLWTSDYGDLFNRPAPAGYCWLTIGAAACAATYAIPRFPWPGVRLAFLFMIFAALGASLVRATPEPAIDVWHFQNLAAQELLAGRNPYAAHYPNIYGNQDYYGVEVLTADRSHVKSFPYPPLSLLLVLPGYLAGDVRWSMLAAMGVSAFLLVLIGRRLGLPLGHPVELVAVLLMFRPSWLKVLDNGWTEPLLCLAAGLTGLALVSQWRWGLILGTAALLSVKQYGVLCLPALVPVARFRRTDWLWIGGLAMLPAIPFAVWDMPAIWSGVVAFQVHQPFRGDSITVLAMIARETGTQASSAFGFALAAVIAALVAWRARGRPFAFPVGCTAILLAFFLFNKQAFLNYYWFVFYMSAMGAVFAAAKELPAVQAR